MIDEISGVLVKVGINVGVGVTAGVGVELGVGETVGSIGLAIRVGRACSKIDLVGEGDPISGVVAPQAN